MSRRGRFRRWSLDHKLQFWSIVVGSIIAVAAIVVPVVVSSGGGSSAPTVGTSNGQVNIGGTVNNYAGAGEPNPAGPSVQSNVCPLEKAPQTGSIDTLYIDLQVRPYRNGECWARSTTLGLTPSTVEFEISYTNASRVDQNDVVFGVKLPKGLQMVPSSTYLKASDYPNGLHIDTDAIGSTGVILGTWAPGASGYVAFEAETPAVGDLKCGNNVLRTIASVQPKGLNYSYNTADVDLTRDCPTSASRS